MKIQHQLIIELARKVRTWAEKLNNSGVNLGTGSKCLNGWCAIASAQLFRELAAAKIPAQIHMYEGINGSHVFLTVDDHVIDVTATQFPEFSKKKIVFMHIREAEAYDFYRIDSTFKSVETLCKFQIKNGWPASQTAYAVVYK